MDLQELMFKIDLFVDDLLPHPQIYCCKCKREIKRYETHIIKTDGKKREHFCFECDMGER